MVVIYRKRGKANSNFMHNQVQQALKDRKCPKCKVPCVEVQTDPSNISMYCSKCGATIRLAGAAVTEVPRQNEQHFGPITLRDKSKDSTKEQSSKEAPADVRENIASVRQAFSSNRLIKFSYVAKDGTKSQRTVEGYKLTKDGSGALVLYGYCLDQENIRMFKLDKISVVEITDMEYKPRWPVEDTTKKDKDE